MLISQGIRSKSRSCRRSCWFGAFFGGRWTNDAHRIPTCPHRLPWFSRACATILHSWNLSCKKSEHSRDFAARAASQRRSSRRRKRRRRQRSVSTNSLLNIWIDLEARLWLRIAYVFLGEPWGKCVCHVLKLHVISCSFNLMLFFHVTR